jgi:hypothetical protein
MKIKEDKTTIILPNQIQSVSIIENIIQVKQTNIPFLLHKISFSK